MIRRMKAVVALALAVPAFVAAAQRPARDAEPQSLRVVRGEVRADDDSAASLRRARVTVAGSTAPAVFTNQEGQFEVAVPASGNSVLRVSKPGFAPAQVVVSETTDGPIPIRLPRGAAIVARVFDDFGAPAVGIEVRVRRLPAPDERGRAPVDVRIGTDDLGEFRVGSLPAGSYQFAIEAQGAQEAPEPAQVTVRPGEESTVSLFYRGAAEEARRAASYVAGFEAGQRDALLTRMQRTFSTGVVLGRVTDRNGRSVAGALVRLNPVSAGTPRLGATDSQGRFQIGNVAAGSYRVVATKTGFVASEYGQERSAQPGRIVTLRDRQRFEGANIVLPRGAFVAGSVTDPDGEPMEGLAVHVWRVRYWNGRRIAEAVADVAVRRTDDYGRYRLHGLQPGTYYVVASDDPAATSREVTGAPRSFYPGTPTIGEASTVSVDVGVNADAAHVVFNPAQSWRLSGFAADSEGHPLEVPLVLAGSTRSGIANAPQVARMGPGYAFAFDHVTPGSYVIHAIQRLELSDRVLREFGSQFVDVAEYDVENLRVATVKGATVTGRIIVDGDAPGRDLRFPIQIVSADPDFAPPPGQFLPWTVRTNPDRSFEVSGLSGPIRFTSTSAPAGWFLESVDIGGRNAAEEPVTFGTPNDWRGQAPILFSSAGGQVSGRVVNGRNEPVASYVVAAFPVDRTRWYSGSRYLKTALPDEEGRFTIGMVPPGDYWVAAIDALPDGSLEDPELLAQIQQFAERVALSAGERLSKDLRLLTFRSFSR